MRIIFMGTPEFAVPTLRAIHASKYEIVGVITAPDKVVGRGRKKKSISAVKKEALIFGLNILQPPRLKRKSFIKELEALQADIQIVVAFRMLPEVVWNMPPLGTYNLHGSLLPKYRGAAPIHWAVINGEKETGATTFKLKHEIDTGSIALQNILKIGPDDTTGDVYASLMEMGAELMVETLDQIKEDRLKLIDQTKLTLEVSHAPKVNKETGFIKWNKTALEIKNLVRGLNPYPGAWTNFGKKELKIWKVSVDSTSTILEGKWITDGKSYIKIGTARHALSLDIIQFEGKRRMNVKDFINGIDPSKYPFLDVVEEILPF